MLRGLLGADVVGFHTHDYARHFRTAARRVLGADTRAGAVEYQGRSVRVMTEPLGIDTKLWAENIEARPDPDPSAPSLKERIEG